MTPLFYGNADASVILLQMTDTHEEPNLPREFELICKSCPDEKLLLAAVRVDNWNDDLSPWPAPPAFGKDAFGGRAAQTLARLHDEILPIVRRKLVHPNDVRFLIGGYSLAALFALYACYETDAFAACAAASPSVWFPDWMDYARQHAMHPQTIYLSSATASRARRTPRWRASAPALRSRRNSSQTRARRRRSHGSTAAISKTATSARHARSPGASSISD